MIIGSQSAIERSEESVDPWKKDPLRIRKFWGSSWAPYSEIWELQKTCVEEVRLQKASEIVIFCEHEKLVTLGRRAKRENILSTEFPVYEIERGGDVTLHGPGQLVMYPILRLDSKRFPGGLKEYLRLLEELVIQFLDRRGIQAGRFGPTGVWVHSRRGGIKKIASIGIAVRHWTTYHGLALNLSASVLEDFKRIRPCDFESETMTSLESEGIQMDLESVAIEMHRDLEAWLQSRSAMRSPGSEAAPTKLPFFDK